MQIWRIRAEFQHIAEHGNAAVKFGAGNCVECGERRPHRSWVGVIAFVDQENFSAGNGERCARATTRRRRQCREGQEGRFEECANGVEGRNDGKRIFGNVAAGDGNPIENSFVANAGDDVAAVFAEV